jgi:hypothetical protein
MVSMSEPSRRHSLLLPPLIGATGERLRQINSSRHEHYHLEVRAILTEQGQKLFFYLLRRRLTYVKLPPFA